MRLYQQRKFISDHNLALTPIMMNDNESNVSKGQFVNNNNFNAKKNWNWNELNEKENYLSLVSTNKLRYSFFV